MSQKDEQGKLHSLVRVCKAIAAELDLKNIARIVTLGAIELSGARFGAFYYSATDKAGATESHYIYSTGPKGTFKNAPLPDTELIRSDDVHQPQVRSYLAVPVFARSGEMLGALLLGHPEPHRFTNEDEDLVTGIAAFAAVAIDNAHVYGAAQDEIARRKLVEQGLEHRASSEARRVKKSIAKLRDSERNFELLVESVTDYAIYMLDLEGNVVSWNSGAERIKGYTRDEIVGQNYSRFFTEEDRSKNIPATALNTARKIGRYESEGWRIRKDGSRFWSFAVIDAVRDEAGNHIGFAKITRDMTERREAQFQVERAREQLAQAQKMEAVGQLTGGIAHDFNNLLMIVSGQAQLLRNRATQARDIRSLDAIESAAKSGANLTRQLLTFARRQRLNPTVIDPAERLNSFRDLLASSIGGAVKLLSDVPDDIWPIEVDPGELELALVNLAVNARDAMPNGGTLTIRGHNVTCDASAPVALTGEFVALSLTDTGTGIPSEYLTRVFEPFFSTKEVGKGTGLGLSQVYGFAKQSGGDVSIESRLGQGTTVTIYLPRSHAAAAAAHSMQKSARTMHGEGVVLIVEDNADVAEVTAMMLDQMGYRTMRADRPATALGILDSRDDVQLVFSDIVMPGEIDGLTLAETIRKRHPRLPVLLATGYSSAAERAGQTYPILRKPYDAQTLGMAVKHALAVKTNA